MNRCGECGGKIAFAYGLMTCENCGLTVLDGSDQLGKHHEPLPLLSPKYREWLVEKDIAVLKEIKRRNNETLPKEDENALRKMLSKPIPCPICQTKFIPRKNQTYCSVRCRMAGYRSRQNGSE